MQLFTNTMRFGIQSAAPVTSGNTTVTPQALSVALRLPFGGFVWNRPFAVLVERDGKKERIFILDPTRFAQLGIFAATMVAGRLLLGKKK